jgi:hypothetical protein
LELGFTATKPLPKLVAVTDLDEPSIIFRILMSKREKLFEHDCYFLTVRRAE